MKERLTSSLPLPTLLAVFGFLFFLKERISLGLHLAASKERSNQYISCSSLSLSLWTQSPAELFRALEFLNYLFHVSLTTSFLILIHFTTDVY